MKVRSAEFVKSAARLSQVPLEPLPEVAFIGPSNVGKSSLINALLGRRGLAKTSKTPGRTQLLNWFRVNGAVHFVDLPGYGFAKVPAAEQRRFLAMVEEYLGGSQHLCLLLLLQDCRRLPSVRDLELKAWIDESRVPHAIVLTKSDKLSKNKLGRQRKLVREAYGESARTVEMLPFSASSGDGRRELWRLIDQAVMGASGGVAGEATGEVSGGAVPGVPLESEPADGGD